MNHLLTTAHIRSPPARVAWIETLWVLRTVAAALVATREGGVDRNVEYPQELGGGDPVATREGGVDRNIKKY